MKTKIMTFMAACLCAAVAFSDVAFLPRSEWIGQVGDCVQNPSKIGGIMSQLSPADQCSFLGEMNTAISKMAGSPEEKGAAFLKVNRLALVGATAANRADMLAEVFATVPPEYLTVINENFAETIFSRTGVTSRTYTDAEFTALCENALAKIYARTASVENSAVRNTFAIMMFVRSSGGSPENLADTLADKLPSGKDIAKSDWLPSALGKNQTKSYDSILGAAQADDEPNHEMVVSIAGPQMRQALLGDLQGMTGAKTSTGNSTFSDAMGNGQGHLSDLGMLRIPRAEVLTSVSRYYSPYRDNNGGEKREPGHYYHQDIHLD